MSISKVSADISSAWDDEVGASISRHARTATEKLSRAAAEYERAHKSAEAGIKSLPSYTSRIDEIRALKFD